MAKNKKKIKVKSLKKYKEEYNTYINNSDYEKAYLKAIDIIDKYPKNIFGYLSVLKAKTHNYTLYISEEELKDLKKIYENIKNMENKKDKNNLKEFEEYLSDLKEATNLKKIKKEIIGKELIKLIYEKSIDIISQNIILLNTYKKGNNKIKNVFDLINGFFLLLCLIYNLIFRNYLLILTIPFGIFGIINIYSFINMNFLNKNINNKNKINKFLNNDNSKLKELKEKYSKNNETIKFLYEQKVSIMSKIPSFFLDDLKSTLSTNEKEEAKCLFNYLLKEDTISFTLNLNSKTNINIDDIKDFIDNIAGNENEKIKEYIALGIYDNKNRKKEIVYAKKITLFNIVLTVIFLIISTFSFMGLVNNFYEINKVSFIVAVIVGILSAFLYSIYNVKFKSFFDVSNDNLLLCVSKATLTYNLIYSSITNELKLTYGFIQIPLTFLIILIGYVMTITLFKYRNFLKGINR